MAREPGFADGGQIDDLVHHSDRSVQCTSIRYTQRLEEPEAGRSVGSKGDSYDNAAAESLNSLYKRELIDFCGNWQGPDDVITATADWVLWYSEVRLHSYCRICHRKRTRKSTIKHWRLVNSEAVRRHCSLQTRRGEPTVKSSGVGIRLAPVLPRRADRAAAAGGIEGMVVPWPSSRCRVSPMCCDGCVLMPG